MRTGHKTDFECGTEVEIWEHTDCAADTVAGICIKYLDRKHEWIKLKKKPAGLEPMGYQRYPFGKSYQDKDFDEFLLIGKTWYKRQVKSSTGHWSTEYITREEVEDLVRIFQKALETFKFQDPTD